jgi:hypothetical protein
MDGNGNHGPGTEVAEPPAAPEAVLWRKGNLRDENEASSCKHLQVGPLIEVKEILRAVHTQNRIASPHDSGMGPAQLQSVNLYPGMPPLKMICTNPVMRANAKRIVPPEVMKSVAIALPTCLDVCRLCPLWEAEEKQ